MWIMCSSLLKVNTNPTFTFCYQCFQSFSGNRYQRERCLRAKMLSMAQVRWWIGQFFVLILCFSRWRYKDNSTLRHNLIRVSQEQRENQNIKVGCPTHFIEDPVTRGRGPSQYIHCIYFTWHLQVITFVKTSNFMFVSVV